MDGTAFLSCKLITPNREWVASVLVRGCWVVGIIAMIYGRCFDSELNLVIYFVRLCSSCTRTVNAEIDTNWFPRTNPFDVRSSILFINLFVPNGFELLIQSNVWTLERSTASRAQPTFTRRSLTMVQLVLCYLRSDEDPMRTKYTHIHSDDSRGTSDTTCHTQRKSGAHYLLIRLRYRAQAGTINQNRFPMNVFRSLSLSMSSASRIVIARVALGGAWSRHICSGWQHI